MIGLVVVSHGNLAAEMVAAMEHVVGPQEAVATIGMAPQDDIEAVRRAIIDAVERVDGGDGAVLLTDMFGGTPSNLAMSLLDTHHVDVIAGVNLPVLVKLAEIRASLSLAEAVSQAAEAGKHYIRVASQLLSPAAARTGTE